MPFSRPDPHSRSSIAGFSLIEALIAMGVSIITLTGVMMMNSSALKLVWSTRQTNAATLSLQERVEQFRITNWQQLTSATYLRDGFFANAPRSAGPLDGLVETVTISAYPDSTATGKLMVERRVGGSRVLLAGTGIAVQPLARVDFRIEWTGDKNRTRVRESSTIISKTGVSRLNLSLTGNNSTPAPTATPAPSGTPAPTATPGPSATPTPTPAPTATPTPTPAPTGTPTPTPGNNGNGNGRGNVGGNSGKK